MVGEEKNFPAQIGPSKYIRVEVIGKIFELSNFKSSINQWIIRSVLLLNLKYIRRWQIVYTTILCNMYFMLYFFFFYINKNIYGQYHSPRYEFSFQNKRNLRLEIFCSPDIIFLLEFFSLILVNLSSDVFHKR